jgi:hypothetical protein
VVRLMNATLHTFRFSLYGRERLDGPNIVLLWRAYIESDPDLWTQIDVACGTGDYRVRCLVLKLEVLRNYTAPPDDQGVIYATASGDQVSQVRPPPYGVRILESNIFASDLGTYNTPERVVADIVEPFWSGENFQGPAKDTFNIDQLVYDQLPKTRLDALQEVDALLDWDYEATKDSFSYQPPITPADARDDQLYSVSLADPHMSATITPAMDECCNGVRALYTDDGGRAQEVVLWGVSETLGARKKCKVLTLDSSIHSKKQARIAAQLYLNSHLEPTIAGAPKFVGSVPVASGEDRDCLLMRPGELVQITDAPLAYSRTQREISGVTLHPLTHEAEVELGAKSRRFDRWLARLGTRKT